MRENQSVSGARTQQGQTLARVCDAKMVGFIHICKGRGAYAYQRRQTRIVQITARRRGFLSGEQIRPRHARNLIINTA